MRKLTQILWIALILHGAVVCAEDTKAEAEAEPKLEEKTDSKSEAKAEPSPEAKSEEPKTEVKTEEAKALEKSDTKSEEKTEAEAETEPKAEVKSEAKAEVKSEPTIDPKTGTKSDKELGVSVTNPSGGVATEIEVDTDVEARDILFRPKIPENYRVHRSWAFEISDPQHGLSFQVATDGIVPEVLHWDGYFSDGTQLKYNQRYYIRIILVDQGGSTVVSPWGFFTAKVKKPLAYTQNKGDTISLYITPIGGAYVSIVKTKASSSVVFPSFLGEMQVIYLDQHTIGVRAEATSNTLFGFNPGANAFVYSDANVFYRYRLLGAPIRAPALPLVPPSMGYKFKLNTAEAFGKPANMGVGIKLFHTVLRGSPGSPIDAELARLASGLAATFDYDRVVGSWRIRGIASLGYTFFAGRSLLFGAEAGLSYDRIVNVAPTLHFRYSLLTGSPPSDDVFASSSITNHLLFIGFAMHFKI